MDTPFPISCIGPEVALWWEDFPECLAMPWLSSDSDFNWSRGRPMETTQQGPIYWLSTRAKEATIVKALKASMSWNIQTSGWNLGHYLDNGKTPVGARNLPYD